MWPTKPTWIVGCIIYLTLNAYVHGTSSFKDDENTAINFRKTISPVSRINKGDIRSSRQKKSRKHKRPSLGIINGVPAALGQLPWMAGLIFHKINPEGESRDWHCGGALIKPYIVLTGATAPSNQAGYKAMKVTVVLGSLTMGKGGTRIESTDIRMHHSFANEHNDIALIRLPSPVELSDYIQPIDLPSGSQLSESFAGEIAVAAGYGWLYQDKKRHVLEAPLSFRKKLVLEYNVCQKIWPSMTENLICTDVAEAKDNDKKFSNSTICPHDCGGPLFVYTTEKPILIGVMLSKQCDNTTHLDLYTRVTSYISWIQDMICDCDHNNNKTGTITNNTDSTGNIINGINSIINNNSDQKDNIINGINSIYNNNSDQKDNTINGINSIYNNNSDQKDNTINGINSIYNNNSGQKKNIINGINSINNNNKLTKKQRKKKARLAILYSYHVVR